MLGTEEHHASFQPRMAILSRKVRTSTWIEGLSVAYAIIFMSTTAASFMSRLRRCPFTVHQLGAYSRKTEAWQAITHYSPSSSSGTSFAASNREGPPGPLSITICVSDAMSTPAAPVAPKAAPEINLVSVWAVILEHFKVPVWTVRPEVLDDAPFTPPIWHGSEFSECCGFVPIHPHFPVLKEMVMVHAELLQAYTVPRRSASCPESHSF